MEDYGGEDQVVIQNRRDTIEKIERLRKATVIASSAWRKTRGVERLGVYSKMERIPAADGRTY